MHELQNVLYVVTPGSFLHLEHDTVRVEVERATRARLPLLNLSGIVVFGRVLVSPYLIERCARDGRSLVWLDDRGRFNARLDGPVRGNVLLRRAQHLSLSDPAATCEVARQIVAAKIQNSRQVILRAAREPGVATEDRAQLSTASERLADVLVRLREATDLEVVRGFEGEAARTYFRVFPCMIRTEPMRSAFDGRTRRPPRDPVNAVLSFLYALLRTECSSALDGVGLDPQVGYLHALRPGRPALALDLMEEFRSVFADRLALNLINRRQLTSEDFEELPGGAVHLTDDGRRTLLGAWQRRKETKLTHPGIQRRLTLGLVPHIQARLLARHLRGDLAHYPPFLYR